VSEAPTAAPIEIVPFRDEYARDFERLNREWLEGFGLIEAGDLPYMEDPRGTIVDRGGTVLFAVAGGAVIGTVALLRQSAEVFELAKMTVAREARGRGLGRRLIREAVAVARSQGARRITLSSNHRLVEAIHLYESLGFRHTAADQAGVAYANADVHMALDLAE